MRTRDRRPKRKTRSDFFIAGAIGLLIGLGALVSGCTSEVSGGSSTKVEPEPDPSHVISLDQFGSGYDSGRAIATDASGQSVVTGVTTGDLAGTGHMGRSDVFVAKYDAQGARLWIRQFGTAEDDEGHGVVLDAAGNSYVAGYTEGDLDGNGNAGGADAFVAKLDPDGNLQWVRQIGSFGTDNAYAVAGDAGGTVTIAGYTTGSLGGLSFFGSEDAFVARFDTNGNVAWIKQFGTLMSDSAHGVAVDALGNSYVAGPTFGDLDGNGNMGRADIYLAKFDGAGEQKWVRQWGSTDLDSAEGVATDANGTSTLAGYTYDTLPGMTSAGGKDAFAAQVDTNGNLQWMDQFGSSSYDSAEAVAMDASGGAVITGATLGNLDGSLTPETAGFDNPFLVRYNASGNQEWVRLIGTAGNDTGNGVGLDASGGVYTTGSTWSALAGTG